MTDRDRAYEDYLAGMKYQAIADKYNVSLSTIKSWATRYWKKDGCNQMKKVATKKEKKLQPEKVATEREETEAIPEVISVMENDNLTEKQRLFCIYFVRSFNATKAYQKAYGCSYENAMVEGSKFLRKPKIKKEIQRLKQERLTREFLSEEDIFQKYMDIAFADITDFLEFGTEEVPVMAMYGPVQVTDPETGEKKALMKTVNTVRFKKSAEVDGSILAEVKQGKDGASIKLSDRMKALQWLSDHMDIATEEQRVRVEKMKADVAKATGTGNEKDLEKLDELLGQIRKAADEHDTES